MPNPYFRFKQFTVYHDRCAMKVGTDGVLLGAWADISNAPRILDIGTGSGLIALMLAQRSEAKIDALEIDKQACAQAQENVNASPWANRIQIYHQSLQDYVQTASGGYDLLIANPPFFQSTPASTPSSRSLARQSHHLTPEALLQAAPHLLGKAGRLAVIYPVDRAERFEALSIKQGFICRRKLYIKPKHHLPTKRILLDLQQRDNAKTSSTCTPKTLVIEEAERYTYTPAFIELIKDFYLKY